jgi:hypothetical protein
METGVDTISGHLGCAVAQSVHGISQMLQDENLITNDVHVHAYAEINHFGDPFPSGDAFKQQRYLVVLCPV